MSGVAAIFQPRPISEGERLKQLRNRVALAASLPVAEARKELQRALAEFNGEEVADYPILNRVMTHWLTNGGRGFGNFGHAGIPGHRGGSAAGDSVLEPIIKQDVPENTKGVMPSLLQNRQDEAYERLCGFQLQPDVLANSEVHKGCLMAMLPTLTEIPKWAEKNLPPEVLAADGIEREPHVNVMFGWLPSFDMAKLAELLKTVGPIKFKITNLDKFEVPEKGYDVLKFRVDSPDLISLNALLQETFGADLAPSDFSEYVPHLTMAYVKQGTEVPQLLLNAEATVSSLTFSTPDRQHIELPLQ